MLSCKIQAMKELPGQAFHKGIPEKLSIKTYSIDRNTERWFSRNRWPNAVCCSGVRVRERPDGLEAFEDAVPPCREKAYVRLGVSTETVRSMDGSKLGHQDWIIAMFLLNTSRESVSGVKLHCDLDVAQKSARILVHRLRDTLSQNGTVSFDGLVVVDETYMGSRRRNMSNARREALADTGRDACGRTLIASATDEEGNQTEAEAVTSIDSGTLQRFVNDPAVKSATVYADNATAYDSLRFDHEWVKHSLSEYVQRGVHTNGIESLWSMLRPTYKGTSHKLSTKHHDRYMQELAGRDDMREVNTINQTSRVQRGMEEKHLRYRELIADNGLVSDARA